MVSTAGTVNDVDVDLGRLFGSLRSRWRRVLGVALLAALAAFVLATLMTPKYKAETRILIETRESVFTRPDATRTADAPILDEQGVTSQVEVITSTDLLKKVAAELGLQKLPEFDEAARMSALDHVLVLLGLRHDPRLIPPEERVLAALRERLEVYRVEKSRVIVVEVWSEDPGLAAAIPNTIADEYIALNSGAKLAADTDAADWLGPEIAELSKKVKEAEARVAGFRASADLPAAGQANASLATQQLTEVSSELSRVRAARAAADANAQRMRAALAAGGSLETLPEVISSPLIQRLRENEIQLRADIADLSTTLLENHPRIRSLRAQLANLERQIRTEAQNVLEGLVNESRAAQMRETELTAELNRLKAASANADEKTVELRALERDAAAQRDLLESYMTRYREAASRRDASYQPADARIFSRAVEPAEPFSPKKLAIVATAFVGTLLLMVVATLLEELFSGRALRPAPAAGRLEARKEEAVAEPPLVPAHLDGAEEESPDLPVPAAISPVPILPAEAAPPVAAVPPRRHESFGLGEIGIERAADMLISGGAARAVFVSPEGDEAAAASVLVAREVADAGLRVLLMDLTASGAASRPMLESGAFAGITNLLAAEKQFSEVIHADHFSDCHVIPNGTADPARAMRAADRLPIIMESLTTAYDVVVVECGPADAEGISRLVGEGTEVLVSVIAAEDEEVASTAEALRAGGYGKVTFVTPAGYEAPPPVPGRSVA